jgi:hypothetical protein
LEKFGSDTPAVNIVDVEDIVGTSVHRLCRKGAWDIRNKTCKFSNVKTYKNTGNFYQCMIIRNRNIEILIVYRATSKVQYFLVSVNTKKLYTNMIQSFLVSVKSEVEFLTMYRATDVILY